MAKWSVGIDVTAQDVKMVCLSQKGDRYQLIDQLHIQRDDQAGLEELLRHRAVRRGGMRFSIHDPNIKIRKVTVPIVPKQELEEVIRWALKEAVKVVLEDHLFRYYPLSGDSDDKKQSYLVFAMERAKLQEHLIELQKLGFAHPQAVEPQAQALANCAIYHDELKNTDRTAVLVFDKNLTYFMVISADGVLFYRTFSGVDFGTGPALLFSKIAIEIQYSKESYLGQFPDQPIQHLVLAGEGAGLDGLKAHVEKTLQVPTSSLELEGLTPDYSIAMGLAL